MHLPRLLLVLTLGSVALPTRILAQAGSLDASFNLGQGPNSLVRRVVVQADGRILIGGDFTTVGGTERGRLARLNADGSLDSAFSPGAGANGSVWAIAPQGDGRILVAGAFTSLGGVNRNYLARINGDGSLDATFDPGSGPNGYVNTVAVQPDGKILVGGGFSQVNGVSRANLVRLQANGTVDGSFLLGGGVNGTVNQLLLLADGRVLVAGGFNTVNGTPRNNLVRLNADGSLDPTFDPGAGPNSQVLGMAVQSDGRIVIGGYFSYVNGLYRPYLARLEASGLADPGFAGSANNVVYDVGVQADGRIWAVGEFGTINAQASVRVARLLPDGSVDPGFTTGNGFNSTAFSLAKVPDGGALVAGAFTQYDGASQNYVARLLGTSSATGGEIQFANAEYRVKESAGATTVEVRRTGNVGVAATVAYTTSNGTANAGNYTPQSGTLVFAPTETTKTFTIPVRRNNLVEDDKTVRLTLSNPTGGAVLGSMRTALLTIMNVDKSSAPGGLDVDFRPAVNNPVVALAVQADAKIVLGGDFSAAGGVNRQRLARLNADGTVDASFASGTWFNDRVTAIALQPDGRLLCGGRFTIANHTTRNRLARLNLDGTLDPMFDPGNGPNGEVYRVLYLPDDTLLIAGSFNYVGSVNIAGIARLYVDGTLDRTFKVGSGANSTVTGLAVQPDGKIVLGGSFTVVNGVARNYVARLNADGSVDPTFDPGQGPNGGVSSVAVQPDGKIVITGGFGTVNGLSRPYVARLLPEGLADAGFNTGTGPNGYIYTAALQPDGKIAIGGDFSAVNGQPRARVARLRGDGSLDPSFDPGTGANTTVVALAYDADGSLLVGGNFTQFADFERPYLVRLIGTTSPTGGEIAFVSGTYEVSESQPLASIQVQRSGNTSAKATVAYFTSNGTANAGNYTPQSGSLAFGIGETVKTFTIPIRNNSLVEDDKTILLTLTNATGGAILGSQNTAVLTLVNDDTSTQVGGLDTTFRTGLNGQVLAAALQPDGKWVVCGDFSVAGGQNRMRLARLNASGELDPDFYSAAYANDRISTVLVQADGKILLGGRFTVVNGVTRNRVARLYPDGSLDPLLDPGTGPNGEVNKILTLPDDSLLIAGSFNNVSGVPRNYLARLYTDGSVDPTFDIGTGANTTINTMALQTDGRILLGGNFTTFDGVARSYLARLSGDGTLDDSFDPGAGPNGPVYALAVQSDGRILIGGAFSWINGINRPYLARLNTDGLVDLSFDTGSGPNSYVYAVLVQPDAKVVAGGSFTAFNSQPMNRLVRLRPDGSWDASFDLGNGASDTVNTLALQGDGRVVVGGNFAQFDGVSRGYLARMIGVNDAAGGELAFSTSAYRVAENQSAATIEVRRSGNRAGTVAVAYATSNGTASAGYYTPQSGTLVFGPNETSKTFSVPVRNNNLVEDDKTVNLTLSNPTGGSVLGSQRTAVLTIVNEDNNSTPGALDAAFQPAVNASVGGMAVLSDGRIAIAGNFSTAGGVNRMRMALLQATGEIDPGFYAGAWINDQVNALVVQSDGRIVVGGRFTMVNGAARNRLARFLPDGTLDPGFDPGAGPNGEVHGLAALSDGGLLVGGAFNSFAGVARGGFAKLYTDASLDRGFDIGTGFGGNVYAFAAQPDGKVVAVGNFTTFNGSGRNRLARLNQDGSLDATFNPGDGLNSDGYAVAIQPDGKILVGGAFSQAGGLNRSFLARFNADGVADTGFDIGSGFNSYVQSLAVQNDGLILVGGSFTSCNGQPHYYLVRLQPSGAIDPAFNTGAGPNNAVLRIATQADGSALIAGNFTQYDGVARNYLARLLGTASAPRLSFVSVARATGGQIRLTLAGQAGQRFLLQTSPDLRSWTPVWTNVLPAASWDWLDSSAGPTASRFYRAISLP